MKVKELINKANEFTDIMPWQTHYPIILGVLNHLQPLTIVECGSGNYSGQAFSCYLAGNRNATCLSLDNNKQWIEGLDWQRSDRHWFKLVEDWDMYKLFSDKYLDCVFIDVDPEEARIPLLEYWRNNAKVVIHHDSQYPSRYGDIWKKYNYVIHDKRLPMNTSACSMDYDVTEWFI